MPDGDWRPFTVPDTANVPAYWKSGQTCEDLEDDDAIPSATVCAVVDAPDEEQATRIVNDHWKPGDFRFIEEKEPGFRPGDRFPWPAEKN
jgi:hypothetical protein